MASNFDISISEDDMEIVQEWRPMIRPSTSWNAPSTFSGVSSGIVSVTEIWFII